MDTTIPRKSEKKKRGGRGDLKKKHLIISQCTILEACTHTLPNLSLHPVFLLIPLIS